MEYLNEQLKKRIASLAMRAPHTFFFLDYDGTLTPIMPRPDLAKLRPSTRNVLHQMSKNPHFSVAIITGRRIEDIQALVGLQELVYAGNQGLELKGPDFSYTHAKTKLFRRIFQDIVEAMKTLPEKFPGSFMEDKGVTLSYHHRLMDDSRAPELAAEFLNRISPWLKDRKVTVLEAKKALEVRPNFNWNKGSAVRWILLHEDPESLPIYLGDDKTDEQAFKNLEGEGVTIKVGYDEKSSAQYYLKDVEDVERFLASMSPAPQNSRQAEPLLSYIATQRR